MLETCLYFSLAAYSQRAPPPGALTSLTPHPLRQSSPLLLGEPLQRPLPANSPAAANLTTTGTTTASQQQPTLTTCPPRHRQPATPPPALPHPPRTNRAHPHTQQ